MKQQTEKVVARILFAYDMDHMYPNKYDNPGLCPICHNTIEQIPDTMYKVRKRKGDVFGTYDGFIIVTEKFKQFCEERNYPHLIFTPFVKSPGYYFFLPQDIYQLDYERREVKFTNKRSCCGCYDEVTGCFNYKAVGFSMPTNDFICRAEYFFGSYSSKGPVIIVGLETAVEMKKYGLKGIYFKDIFE